MQKRGIHGCPRKISLQSVKMIYIQHTKDKIDPDYFTCNVIEC